jgi:cytochrome bd ubiquinol oxidase subunit I
VAVLFAVGAVSGTVLSFELGLLWPGFMLHAGPIIGLPFSWEGTAFFLEAIAIGLYLYGWQVLPPAVHFASGLVVGLSGVASGILVVAANAWMNSPSGFRWVDGRALDVDPVAAMFNAAWSAQAIHMTLAAFASTGLAVAGVHAFALLRDRGAVFHRRALVIALSMGAVASLLQPLSGDHSAKSVAQRQPAKLAAMEALYETQRGAPLLIGGFPFDDERRVRFGLELPKALSFLAHGDLDAEVLGLDRVPRGDWPNTRVCHVAFQIMVAAGTAMAALSAVFAWLGFRRREALFSRAFLRAVVAAAPLGFIAVEAGWTVTEVGRQPWIIQGIMRTRDAVTPMPGLVVPLLITVGVYLVLGVVVVAVLRRITRDPGGAHG